jgi:cytochrome c553
VKLKTRKKILRWLGLVVLALGALAVGAWLLVNRLAQREFAVRYAVNETLSVPRPTDAESVAEGQRLARLTGCTHCHGENLGGAVPLDIPNVARFVAPNLTTILPEYSDAQLVGLLRRGVKRDGSGAWFMPSQMYRHLYDADIARISAWLRTMPKVAGIAETTRFGLLGLFTIAKGDFRSAAGEIMLLDKSSEDRRVPPGRGAYLVMSLCSDCHGQDLDGRAEAKIPSLAVVKGYPLEAFARLMHDGTGPGGRIFELMTPTSKARFAHLTPGEVEAMHVFLQSR